MSNFIRPAVGIDLGTTKSCVGVWRNGSVEIFPNVQGNRTIPSWVAFTQTEQLIGEAAKNYSNISPENSLFDSKRMIGRRYSDQEIQNDMKFWPFKLVDRGNIPTYQIRYKGEVYEFSPIQICSMVVSKMKEMCESYLGHEVTEAVVTLPAGFIFRQRQELNEAVKLAGLKTIRFISETTAAGLTYAFVNLPDQEQNVQLGQQQNVQLQEDKNILVYNCGGGTVSASVVILDGGAIDVKSTSGNTHLGGEDLDNILTYYMADQFKRKYKKDLMGNSRSVGRLRTACERAKRALSTQTQATIEIDSLFECLDFNAVITRAQFEQMCDQQFRMCLEPIDRALLDSKLDKSKIDEIVLVGGSTRIPRIQQLIKEKFNGKELYKSINPDEAVAYGAAVQAAIIKGTIGPKGYSVLLMDLTPISLGIETAGGVMTFLISRNTPIPCQKQETLTTYQDGQTSIGIQIYEGENQFAKQNRLIGAFILDGIVPAPRGVPKITVQFDIDANGILQVSAEDKGTGRRNLVTITNDVSNEQAIIQTGDICKQFPVAVSIQAQ
ncbi:MAG: putative Heat shock cognate 70 kDa protein 1 [Streblomastix strix]|uniref:Putative Heat shock cognate 70 kDa protein 1 n=1 Tax=Streblomastix strix TaxID=222440 RepID=A0A5J4WYU0_9EUKA|nr:MAG: putative Heat shock cognate 70 kDa protein 1 [Streblomastix strix]